MRKSPRVHVRAAPGLPLEMLWTKTRFFQNGFTVSLSPALGPAVFGKRKA
jgi:hypothetical protein